MLLWYVNKAIILCHLSSCQLVARSYSTSRQYNKGYYQKVSHKRKRYNLSGCKREARTRPIWQFVLANRQFESPMWKHVVTHKTDNSTNRFNSVQLNSIRLTFQWDQKRIFFSGPIWQTISSDERVRDNRLSNHRSFDWVLSISATLRVASII